MKLAIAVCMYEKDAMHVLKSASEECTPQPINDSKHVCKPCAWGGTQGSGHVCFYIGV